MNMIRNVCMYCMIKSKVQRQAITYNNL
uniref:Uncharacterized protein n=1 Tax=Rhizophora mucronata TaxID=61149 RepID=A0A2P2NDV4_RHIMU